MIFAQCSPKKKRKIRRIALLAANELLLASCGKADPPAQTESDAAGTASAPGTEKQKAVTTLDAQTGHFYDSYWDDASERIAASITYPCLRLGEADRKAYPKLEQALAALMQERKENKLELYEEAKRAAKETPVEETEHPPFYEVTETVAVRRADSRVFSLVFDGFFYTGGVHGQPYTAGAVFDTQTGKKLQLSDVVTDPAQLPGLVREQLEKYWDTSLFYEDLDLNTFFRENLDAVAWTLDYHGVTLYFNPYEIAPYASGTQHVTLSFAAHPELFLQKYQDVPASYGIELLPDQTFFYDTDGNGEPDALQISPAGGADRDYAPQTIRLNETRCEEDTGIFLLEPVLMHTADGRNYLYLGMQYPEESWVYAIYSLNASAVTKLDVVNARRHQVIDDAADCTLRAVLTDSQDFVLDTFLAVLGTAYGSDSYAVGADGLPVKKHAWYVIEHPATFTLLQPLSADTVDEDGKAVGKTTLPAAEQVTYYRTDGESWADFKRADGSTVRAAVACTDGVQTVNGVPAERVFDKILYAE